MFIVAVSAALIESITLMTESPSPPSPILPIFHTNVSHELYAVSDSFGWKTSTVTCLISFVASRSITNLDFVIVFTLCGADITDTVTSSDMTEPAYMK